MRSVVGRVVAFMTVSRKRGYQAQSLRRATRGGLPRLHRPRRRTPAARHRDAARGDAARMCPPDDLARAAAFSRPARAPAQI
jgi:hypothetical protein